MKGNERILKFLELQNKDVNIDDIAKELGITSRTLKSFLNKNGYRLDNGKYVLKDEEKIDQIAFTEISKDKNKKIKNKKEVVNKSVANKSNSKKSNQKKVNTKIIKKDKKINLTQEDLDKLCEVYDWYLQVKDFKSIKPKKTSNKKDINIEGKIVNLKNTSIRVDKDTWEEFERLCSNSQYSKQEIITQALKNFMKEYKNLL